MKLIRTQLPSLRHPVRLNDLFEHFADDAGEFARWFGLPTQAMSSGPERIPVDLFEDDHEYRFRFELPGFKKDEVSLRIDGQVLRVEGNRPATENSGGLTLVRGVPLPGPVASEQVTAKLEDGVLTVALPRHEEAKPRAITIE